MGRYFYKGLRFRMAFLFSLVFMLISILFGQIVYRYFRNSYVENYDKYLFTRAKTILSRTEINPDLILLPDSGESVRIFYHDNQQRNVLVFQSPGIISKLSVPYRSGIVDSLGQRGVYLKKEAYDGRPVELFFTVSSTSIKERLSKLSLLMILVTAASVLISAIASFLASGWLLRPIRSIANQATLINGNKLGTRIKIEKSHDELQQLTETINEMIGRIEQEQQTQNNFFAAASHELRTPLANLRAETELELKNRDAAPDRLLLDSQLQEISRLQNIVEQFLLISQFKHNGLTIKQETTDLSDQLLKIFSRNSYNAKKNDIAINIHFENNIRSFHILGDNDKLEIVWQNLLQNALKHAERHSLVNCHISQISGYLVVSFENSTVEESIDTQNLTGAFIHRSTITSGSGLGLWLCDQIVEAHGGSIGITSSAHRFRVLVKLPIMN